MYEDKSDVQELIHHLNSLIGRHERSFGCCHLKLSRVQSSNSAWNASKIIPNESNRKTESVRTRQSGKEVWRHLICHTGSRDALEETLTPSVRRIPRKHHCVALKIFCILMSVWVGTLMNACLGCLWQAQRQTSRSNRWGTPAKSDWSFSFVLVDSLPSKRFGSCYETFGSQWGPFPSFTSKRL
jgi:hypothetical protein